MAGTLTQAAVQDDVRHLFNLLAVADELATSKPPSAMQPEDFWRLQSLIHIARGMADIAQVQLLEDFEAHARAADDEEAGR